jgi:hypothetical protein
MAAFFLPSEGLNGLRHLPALLRCCKKVVVTEAELPKNELGLIRFGPVALGDLVGQAGFDNENPLHCDILDWLIQSASSSNLELSAAAIWGLGMLRTAQPKAVESLVSFIEGNRREVEHELISLRAIALRMLARIDIRLAVQYRKTDTWKELRRWYEGRQSDTPTVWLRDEFTWMLEAESHNTGEQ